jgi:hypothetical protein
MEETYSSISMLTMTTCCTHHVRFDHAEAYIQGSFVTAYPYDTKEDDKHDEHELGKPFLTSFTSSCLRKHRHWTVEENETVTFETVDNSLLCKKKQKKKKKKLLKRLLSPIHKIKDKTKMNKSTLFQDKMAQRLSQRVSKEVSMQVSLPCEKQTIKKKKKTTRLILNFLKKRKKSKEEHPLESETPSTPDSHLGLSPTPSTDTGATSIGTATISSFSIPSTPPWSTPLTPTVKKVLFPADEPPKKNFDYKRKIPQQKEEIKSILQSFRSMTSFRKRTNKKVKTILKRFRFKMPTLSLLLLVLGVGWKSLLSNLSLSNNPTLELL